MNEDEKKIKDFVDQRMQEELSIKNPAGIIPPKKQVRLMIGEGEDKFEIGVAELETMPDGTVKVDITLTAEKYAEALGIGVKLTGILPAFPVEIDHEHNRIAWDADALQKDFEQRQWEAGKRPNG